MTAPALTYCTPGRDCDLGQELRDRWLEAAEHPDAHTQGTWAWSCRRFSHDTYRRHIQRCRKGEEE